VSTPRILVSPDLERRQTRRGPLLDVLTFDTPYTDRVIAVGGLPLLVPIGLPDDLVDELVRESDGVLFTGGDFDVDPTLFGEAPIPQLGTLKPTRTALELALWHAAARHQRPVLGICGGAQLINVACGGTLWQDLPSQRPSTTAHSQVATKDLAGHHVEVVADTRLAALCGAGTLGVNSTHHQGIKAVASSLRASAVADDGLVEAIESVDDRFVLGVQWHPESMNEAAHRAIYRGFIEAARRVSR
jgi:putative glutamine amidotransferase